MSVVKEEIADIGFIGGVLVDIERGFRECDYTESLQNFFPVLESTHAKHFASQSDPAGVPWAPLSPRTIKRKGHSTILFETGRLKASLVGQTGDSIRAISDRGQGALFGTSVPYSIFHDVGGGNLPQRRHVGMIDETLQLLVDSVANRSVESLKIKL